MSIRNLYPEIEPNHSYRRVVDDIHEIYFEESGNPAGVPVIFLHGGPGAGSNENHRRYFDPVRYRIINFDQRGCHRSTPAGEIKHNTTRDLLKDIELIREELKIGNWLIFGGSWGATLGLLYAQKHPQRVLGMILRGSFLARKRDQLWFTGDGVKRIFPDLWEDFRSFIPPDEQKDLVSAYYTRITSDDTQLVEQAARHWSDWAGRIVTYTLDIDEYVNQDELVETINQVKIETHYASNRYFIGENQILKQADKIPDVPVCIIHGRRDLTCTLEASWELSQALPGAELVIVKTGGHLASEPVMTSALITATDDILKKIS